MSANQRSRPSRASRTASSALRAPLVFGKRRKRFGSMKSRMFANGSCFPERSARRSATVTISVPLATSASRINSFEANLPVPTSNREVNSRSAMRSLEGLSAMDSNVNDFLYDCELSCTRDRVASECRHPERERGISRNRIETLVRSLASLRMTAMLSP